MFEKKLKIKVQAISYIMQAYWFYWAVQTQFLMIEEDYGKLHIFPSVILSETALHWKSITL